MEDLFSNGPKNDDFEDISSHSSSGDEFEDIFSNSQKEIDDLFSDSSKEPVRGNADGEVRKDFDMSYFSYTPKNGDSDETQSQQGEDMKNEPIHFEDISSNGKGKNKGGKKRAVITIIAGVLIVLLIIGGFVLYNYNDILNQLNYKKSEKNKYVNENELTRGDGITNILLIGSDSRVSDTSGSRSDTTILLSVDTKSKQLKLASFLRDTYIEIPE